MKMWEKLKIWDFTFLLFLPIEKIGWREIAHLSCLYVFADEEQ